MYIFDESLSCGVACLLPARRIASRAMRIIPFQSGRVRASKNSAVSEIVGSLIMIVVVVALMTTLLTVSNTAFGSIATNFSNLIGTQQNALSERIVVEQVTFNETGSKLGANIYVRDIGTYPASISSVYVTNVSAGTLAVSYNLNPPKQISPGQFQIVAVAFTPNSGTTYSFTIVTQLGNEVVVNEVA